MNTLHFEKISKFNRKAEPVSVALPFAEGALKDKSSLVIFDGNTPLPLQREPLGHWKDGSVKWLLVHFQPDLPGNNSKILTFHSENSGAAPPPPVQKVSVKPQNDGLCVHTGPLELTIGENGYDPVRDVSLNGRPLPLRFSGFNILCGDEKLKSNCAPLELKVEEEGPLRAVIEVTGKHRRPDGSDFIDFRGRITAYAGKPYIEVEHKFIHREEPEELYFDELALRMDAECGEDIKLALGEGFYGTGIRKGADNLSLTIDADTLLSQAFEHFVDSFYGDFWADWSGDKGGAALSIYQAHQNFPKAFEVDQQGITACLYPGQSAQPAKVLRGMGKTHRMLVHFHDADTPLEDISARSLQFQLPDRPALPPEWYRKNNPWVENFFPESLPRKLYTRFNLLHDGRPKALGMMHFGDAPDSNYTDQGRGKGETVYVNNEYDRPHACALFYGLSSQRRALDSALVSARHWLDVDFCHYHPDPLLNGGLRIHTAYHAAGKVDISHQWTEGLLDYYFLTGRSEALETAQAIGENILRHRARPRMNRTGAGSVRQNGWALRALAGLYLATGEERWREESTKIVELFLDWFDEFDAMLAPYTSHSMPRVPFMITLTANSLARYLLVEKDRRVEQLLVDMMDDLLENCLGPDGIFYYKELPSLQRTASLPHALEALAHAYRITGQERYLKIATRQFATIVDSPVSRAGTKKRKDPSGAVFKGEGRACYFASDYTSLLIFAGEAASKGMLNWYEYPFPKED